MPAPIFYQKDAALIEGIRGAGSAFAQALQTRNEEQKIKQKEQENLEKYKKSGGVLNDILSMLPQDATPEQYQNALSQAMQQGVPMEIIKQASDLYKPILAQRAKTQGANSYFQNIFGGQNSQVGLAPSQGPMGQGAINSMGTPMDQGAPVQGQMPTQNVQPQQNQTAFDINKVTDDQITKLIASPYKEHQQLGDAILKRREADQKAFIEDRKYHSKGFEKAQEQANSIRRSIREKEGALRFSREAIETGETGPLSWANIAKRLDVPELMNAAGTELSQAGKEFFFGNMKRVSAKAQNQWLEQRITKLAADVGDPKIAALMKQTMLEGELELDKAYLNAFDRLSKEDQEKFKFGRNDIEERAFKESEGEINKILNKTSFKTRQLYEEEKGAKWLMENAMKKVAKGTMLTPNMAKVISKKYDGDFKKAIENAKKLGYSIPTRQEVESWQ